MKLKLKRPSAVVSAVMIAALALALASRGSCDETCFDCLVRAADEPAGIAPANRSLAGDIVVCRPEGWAWGRKERTAEYAVVRICGLDSGQAELLSSPGSGVPHRFSVDLAAPVVVAGDGISAGFDAVIFDRSASAYVTAKAAADAVAAELEAEGGAQ